MGVAEELGDGGRVRVKEAFLHLWYTVSAPVDLYEFRETAVGVFNANKGVLDPPV